MQQKTGVIFIEEKFCKDVKELETETINYEEKKMIPLTDKEIKFYEGQKVCHICKKLFCYNKKKKVNLNSIIKSEIIVITPENLEDLLIIFAI